VVGENWGSDSGNWILLCEWDVEKCTLVDIWWRFGTTYCHHLHGFSTLEIAPADYSVTPIYLHQVTRGHIPEDHNLLISWSDNLKTPPKFMISRYCIESPKFHKRSEHFKEKRLQCNHLQNLINVSSDTVCEHLPGHLYKSQYSSEMLVLHLLLVLHRPFGRPPVVIHTSLLPPVTKTTHVTFVITLVNKHVLFYQIFYSSRC